MTIINKRNRPQTNKVHIIVSSDIMKLKNMEIYSLGYTVTR